MRISASASSRARRIAAFAGPFLVASGPVAAHTSSQSLVMLLPTGVYTIAGLAVVVLTVLMLAVPALGRRLTRLPHRALFAAPAFGLATVTSLLSTLLLLFAVIAGFTGSRDPLTNPMPLLIWTIWWIGIVFVHTVLGNLWHWINPWTGLHRLIMGSREEGLVRLPGWLGHWLAIAGFFLFSCFMLAHPAPEDPAILARIVAIYWLVSFVGAVVFGRADWFGRCEFVTVMLRLYSHISPFGLRDGAFHIGFPGWKLAYLEKPTVSLALLTLMLLATSSFDGFNETFVWLVILGLNPLEFPGRSGVVGQTVAGIVTFNLALFAVFFACVWIGLAWIRQTGRTVETFCRMSATILPIAGGYHIAHYLTVFLVNAQYTLSAVSDPFGTGKDYLGLGTYYVTTGFFNTRDSVMVIYLTLAGAVVVGHVVSILAAHVQMLRSVGDERKVMRSQAAMVAFMIAYTFFGLWLLAAPRGA